MTIKSITLRETTLNNSYDGNQSLYDKSDLNDAFNTDNNIFAEKEV